MATKHSSRILDQLRKRGLPKGFHIAVEVIETRKYIKLVYEGGGLTITKMFLADVDYDETVIAVVRFARAIEYGREKRRVEYD